MTPMNALHHRARTDPDGTAFIYNDAVWTYRDLLTANALEKVDRPALATEMAALLAA